MSGQVKIIPIMLVIGMCIFSVPAFSQVSNTVYIEQLEDQLFSTKFSNEDITDRLSRLEETIFGESSKSEPEDARIQRLKALLASPTITESPGGHDQGVTGSEEYTYNDENQQQSSSQQFRQETYVPEYADDQEVEDYPAVSFLESQVFNQTFKGEDITKRLERLEQNVFSETKPSLSLSERLEGLKVAITGSNTVPAGPRYSDDQGGNIYQQPPAFNPQQYYQSPQMNTFQNNQQYPSVNEVEYQPIEPGYNVGEISEESLREITERLEEQILGHVYVNEPLNIRLDRLEMHVFNRTEQGYTPESRIERLVAVTAAEATSDPNDLKKINRLRKIQTGLTVGGLLFSILRGFLF